ncbi:hypothetical protein GN956_G1092 [Arapaima gigas]
MRCAGEKKRMGGGAVVMATISFAKGAWRGSSLQPAALAPESVEEAPRGVCVRPRLAASSGSETVRRPVCRILLTPPLPNGWETGREIDNPQDEVGEERVDGS